MNSFIIKADFVYNTSLTELAAVKDGYLVCIDGISKGVFPELPGEYAALPLYDYTGMLCMPGMVDLHIHAPQFAFRGMHMDEELMDWLNRYTFVEEQKFADPEYTVKAYSMFADCMKRSATTRVVVFGTMHREATVKLMELMEETGLISYVGKVNMDRNAPEALLDSSFEMSAYNTIGWIQETKDRFRRTFPILTPRFIPACSNELMNELTEISRTYDLPLQSHLSENPGEVEFVRELNPDSDFYAEGYARFDLFGKKVKTVMAHCIYCPDQETELIRENGVFIAHCPSSNMNLSSGVAPIRKYLEQGIRVGLGSDVAAGESESIFQEIKKAIEVSKLYSRYSKDHAQPLHFSEALYLATKGGGEFFGKVGSFEEGYEVDAIVIDDEKEPHPQELGLIDRAERSVYLAMDRNHLAAKFAAGQKIL